MAEALLAASVAVHCAKVVEVCIRGIYEASKQGGKHPIRFDANGMQRLGQVRYQEYSIAAMQIWLQLRAVVVADPRSEFTISLSSTAVPLISTHTTCLSHAWASIRLYIGTQF